MIKDGELCFKQGEEHRQRPGGVNELSALGELPGIVYQGEGRLQRDSGAASQRVFSFFFFLGPHLRHIEFPRLGVQSEL